ncbi:hypothetical protein ACIQB5_48805 [Streptomyces sp. NPDC088560]|uniref:hypothetical protein n=1 Tax=Streptomyces sp. NPDC088560 TaxID=3365868 RepID=UPI0038032551
MVPKSFTRAAAIVTAVAAVGVGASFAAPQTASAAAQTTRSATYSSGGATFEAQVDNDPGNGAASWLWLADYKWNDGVGAIAHVNYVDGTSQTWGAVTNGTGTVALPEDVSRFQVCEYNRAGFLGCSAWTYM